MKWLFYSIVNPIQSATCDLFHVIHYIFRIALFIVESVFHPYKMVIGNWLKDITREYFLVCTWQLSKKVEYYINHVKSTRIIVLIEQRFLNYCSQFFLIILQPVFHRKGCLGNASKFGKFPWIMVFICLWWW